MDERKILLVNLSKGQVGAETAGLAGGLLLARLADIGLGRARRAEADRRDFYVYLDEFPTFSTDSLAGMLSELRKFRVNLILAHQFLSQLPEPVRDAIFGNVGTLVAFRVGLVDAELLETEFAPRVRAQDIVSISNYAIYTRLAIDGVVSRVFSGMTVPTRKVLT